MNLNQSYENDISCLPLTKARVHLGQAVRRAHVKGEFFTREKDGIAVVGLMHVDDPSEDQLEMQNRSVKAQIQTSTAEYRRGAECARIPG